MTLGWKSWKEGSGAIPRVTVDGKVRNLNFGQFVYSKVALKFDFPLPEDHRVLANIFLTATSDNLYSRQPTVSATTTNSAGAPPRSWYHCVY